MRKHTEGKWTYVDGCITSTALKDGDYVAGGEWEGQMFPFMNDADGVLCAAAPDLLAALEGMLLVDAPRAAALEKSNGYKDGYITKSLAAIAKAKGE